jgi:hydroxyquinol 1,2-dioxygenase
LEFLTADNITQRVVDSFDRTPSPRVRDVMEKLVRHLHAFAREANITREEWLYGVQYLCRAGMISTEVRNEIMGLSDILGLTTVVEFIGQSSDGRTPVNNLGPFYVENAPNLPFDADLRGNQPGEPVLLRGHVVDNNAVPVVGARINLWQTLDNGLYDIQIPELKMHLFRGWMQTNEEGAFQVRTIKPKGYTAPMDGPMGEMLIKTRRNEWRPAHWHFLIRAEGFDELVTELYPAGSPHLDDDVAFGPREALIVDVRTVDDPEEAKRYGMPCPFSLAKYDFKIARSQ